MQAEEDLVYHSLETFEDDMLQAIRERAPGQTILAAFRQFVLPPRGLLATLAPDRAHEATERLQTITRIIVNSPALLAREQQTFERSTRSLGLGADQTSRW